ncbi:MAG: serine hydrolase [Cyclobacteriaceae bacterium]
MRIPVIFLFLFSIMSSCYTGDEVPPDQTTWEYDEPGSNGLSEDNLLELNERISLNQFQFINGLIIIKNNKLVFENYYNNYGRHSVIALDRASVVFTVAALGIALDEGLLSLTSPIYEFLPEYQVFFNDDVTKQDITIEHLLTHRSGLSWNESLAAFIDNEDNNLNQMMSSQDWISFILDRPLQAIPGSFYNLNSGTGVILAKIIENASGRPFFDYLKENLIDLIGITSLSIRQDPSGNYDGGRGISATLIDWTKFGSFMIDKGIWNNRKIIDPNFISEATKFQAPVSAWYNLGYGWWLFGDNFEDSFPIPKDNIYYIPGEIGQHLYIIPDQNMIISIAAENFFFGFGNPSLNLFSEITTSIQ